MTSGNGSRTVALSVSALLFTACFSVQSRRGAAIPSGENPAGTGGVALRVYADDDLKRAGQPGPRGLFVELERREAKGYSPVFKSLEPAWSVMGLPPGDYRLRFPFRLDERGEEVALDERPRTVKVRSGEVTEVEAVLEHVDKGLIVAGVVAAVVAAVLLEDWLDDVDLPAPPLPHLPPPAVLDAIFWISLDLATMPHEVWAPEELSRPPVVTSHFPPDDSLVATRHLRVSFTLSEPLAAEAIAADCVEVFGEASGALPGAASYDAERWWIVWRTDDELPRDDTFRATLFAECVRDLAGEPLAADATFTFRTAG